MIHIYPPSFTDFSINGVVLMPRSCMLSMEINGVWSIQLENSLDAKFQNIVENAIISVPTPYGQARFRITGIDKSNTGISATAVPVFLDASNDTFIYDQRPTNRTGQQALDILTANTKYTGHSDITTPNTAYYQMKNLIECISSDDDNSFLNRWGGEIRYHNYDIYINERLGADNGARVEFGFNLSSVNESIDMTNVVTSIVPVSYNGYTLPNEETIDSPNINKYPTKYIRKIEFNDIKLKEDAQENDEENGVIVCDTLEELYSELRKAAAQKFQEGIDLPSITYQVDMVDLSRTQEYENFKDLVKVNLGDTVYVKHRRLNIETKARIIALEYDCITEKINHLTIGDYVQNYFDKTSDITSSVDKVIDKNNDTLLADKIAGVINLLNTSLRAQKDIAQKQDVRAILFEDLDTNSPTFGALCIGTQGIQISKKRNPENTDWVWGTAINFESIVADYIIAGILSDKLGNNSWNLDTGELRTKNMVAENGTFSGKIEGSAFEGGSININDNFIVDSNGNMIVKANGEFSGNIKGSNFTGGSININDKFTVDENGNATLEDGTFKGKISTKWDAEIGNRIILTPDVGIQSEILLGRDGKTRISISESLIMMELNYELGVINNPRITLGEDHIQIYLDENNYININEITGILMRTKGELVDMNRLDI